MIQTPGVVVVIDSQVEQASELLRQVANQTHVGLSDAVVIGPQEDGIAAIARHCEQIRQRGERPQELHIMAHGTPGCLQLGSARLELTTLDDYAPLLARWFGAATPAALSSAALYLYGCNVAAGDAGAEFVARLHRLTGAGVAASPRRVGHGDLGGDWNLDVQVGTVPPSPLVASGALASYSGVFAPPANDNFADATELTGTTDSDTSTTVDATSEAQETVHDQVVRNLSVLSQAQKQSLNDSIWWQWTAPSDITVTVSTEGSELANTVLAVYTANNPSAPTVGSLQQVAFNDNISDTNRQSEVTFSATAGTTYYFAVDGSITAQGGVTITLDTPPSVDPNQAFTVTENSPAGTEVGTVTASEAGVTWSIVADSNPDNDGDGVRAFRIDETTGVIEVNDAGDLDFEAFPQTYNLQLTVSEGGLSSTGTVVVSVEDGDVPILTEAVLSDTSVDEGSAVSLSGVFNDPDFNDVHTLTIDWGDGDTDVISNDNLSGFDGEGNKTFSNLRHTYADEGQYTITITVEDSDGNTDDLTRIVNVVNVAPTITQGDSATLTVAEDGSGNVVFNATDVGGDDTLTWSILSPAENGNASVSLSPTGTTQSISYTPDADFSGSDSFVVQVIDGDGGVDTITVNVTVSPAADTPTSLALVGSGITIDEADTYTLSGSFFDPDLGDSFTVTIDWGDGSDVTVLTSDSGAVTSDGAGNYVFQSDHPYLQDSDGIPFGINVTVEDSFGGLISSGIEVEVLNVAPTIDQGGLVVLEVTEDGSASFTLSASDVADGSFTWAVVGAGASDGTVTLTAGETSASQTITYTPDADFSDLDSFEVQVSDGDGGTSTVAVLVSVTPVNDAPEGLVLTPDTTSLDEGSAVTLDGSFDDVDFANGDLSEAHTVVIDWGDGSTTTLTAADLGAPTGDTYTLPSQSHTYVDEGSYTVTVTVTDADGASVSDTLTVAVANVAPVITEGDTLTLNITEDTTAEFSLSATDLGLEDGQTWTVVGSPSDGEVTILPAEEGQPQDFVYTPDSNFNGTDTFVVQVSDGDGGTDTITVTVNVATVNDDPVITVNDFVITEGGTLAISQAVLNATDVETFDTALQFTVTGLAAGEVFEVVGGVDNTFSLQDIIDGNVTFIDNGDEIAPNFTITVVDNNTPTAGETSEPGNITFTPVNDAPEILASSFTITEGDTLTLNSGATNLDATDEESADGSLVYTVSNVVGGEIRVGGIPANTFTQEQLDSGAVQFVHDGSETTPSFDFTVSDGEISTPGTALGTLTPVNDAPVIVNNGFEIAEDGILVLSSANISADDPDDSPLSFTVSVVTGGTFQVFNVGSGLWENANTFTSTEIEAGEVRFVQDGTETAPSYLLSVTDGSLSDSGEGTVVFTTSNDDPVVVRNTITLEEGETVLLTAADNLAATDEETADGSITYGVQSVTNGTFIDSSGSPVASFTQQQIDDGEISFRHNGGEEAPTYTLLVGDGTGGIITSEGTIVFTNVNDDPVITANDLVITEGGTLAISQAVLNATDVESFNPDLLFTVTGLAAGDRFAVDGGADNVFTLQDIIEGNVTFIDNGDNLAPSFTITVTDDGIPTGEVIEAGNVTFTAINDAPEVVVSSFTVTEGTTVLLATGDLQTTDEESLAGDLTYTVTSISGGVLRVNGQVSNTFTQAQLDAGQVSFSHDGSETVPSFEFTVSDGEASTPGTATGTLNPVNDPPVIVNNSFAIAEDGILVLSSANISATDPDDSPLSFTVSGVTGGTFQVFNTGLGDWEDATTFTSTEIEAGEVRFVQNGTETAPTYTLSVTDGALSDSGEGTVTFTPINDDPVVVRNTITLDEGDTVLLTTADNLSATDEETPNGDIIYGVQSVTNGTFIDSSGSPVGSFTQQQIDDGEISFRHNGGDEPPTYTLVVSDGTGGTVTSEGTIAFTPVNDNPDIITNTLTLTEAGTVVLTSGNLAATDEETPNDLTYTVESVANGQFELVADPGVAITEFTQAQVNAGAVQFVHDEASGEAEPTYTLSVEDGDGGTSANSEGSITFTTTNDDPVVVRNTLTLNEGDTILLTAADNLAATDEETADGAITYTVQSVTNGTFIDGSGSTVTSFTQQQIDDGAIRFQHDGGEEAPTYTLVVDDGTGGTVVSVGDITFTAVNDDPAITVNSLTVNEGEPVLITTANLNATDVEDELAGIRSGLEFQVGTVSGGVFTQSATISGGQFELVTNPGVAIDSFTRADIINNQVVFVPTDEEVTPSYAIQVVDSEGGTSFSEADITYNTINDLPEVTANQITINEGQVVLLNDLALNLSATDEETPNDDITYTVTSVTAGQFEQVDAVGVEIFSFTQKQVDDGEIRFVHDGTETEPTYTLTVADGDGGEVVSEGTITFENVNDPPEITTNTLTLTEGDTVVLTTANLNATDIETANDSTLVFTITSVTGGQFEFVDSGDLIADASGSVASFTLADVIAENVQFVHTDEETPPAYTVQVSDLDGADPRTDTDDAVVNFTPVNDAPEILTNTLTLTEGGIVLLSDANINSSDAETPAEQLVYTVSGVVGGQFEFVDAPGTEIFSFSQQQINAGEVRFVQDGTSTEPDYVLTVADPQGETSVDDTPDIVFTDINDTPLVVTNQLTLTEGDTIILNATGSNLVASDEESAPGELTYTVLGGSVTGGQFELVADPGNAILSFTQAQVDAGLVQFVHDGTETEPAYTLQLTDSGGTTITSTVDVTFTAVNDAPVIQVNQLDITEEGFVIFDGNSLPIGDSALAATDEETANGELVYTVEAVTNGQFELLTNPGVAITEFTQAQVNAGGVRFVHDADSGEAAPTYTLSVTDGDGLTSTFIEGTVTFTPINDDPEITTNSLTVTEASATVLTSGNLLATDEETPGDLTYTVDNATNGQFEFVNDPGVAITEFTQAQVNAGEVQFVHDEASGEAPPTYTLSAADNDGGTSTLSSGDITFVTVNDAPTIVTNALAVSETGATVLGSGDLLADDEESTDPADLTYTVETVENGQFELVGDPGNAITSFTQAQVNAGAVQFVYDEASGEVPPTYSLSVTDSGGLTSTISEGTVTFTPTNDNPEITTNTLTLTEGDTVVLSAGDLLAGDEETTDPASLTYTVVGDPVAGGQFELVTDPGNAITTFTQAQVNAGVVQFVQDGSETPPAYTLEVADGDGGTATSTVVVDFTTTDDAPDFQTNTLTIAEGGTVVLGDGNLLTIDEETPDDLTYTVNDVVNGQFELVSAPGVEVTEFTQAQVSAGVVQFVHSGSEVAPTYSLTVTDGSGQTDTLEADITFTNTNDAPTLLTNSLTVGEGETVTLTLDDLSATDPDDNILELDYVLDTVSGGTFFLNGVALNPGDSFTRADIVFERVTFTDDGDEVAPEYTITVQDDEGGTVTEAADVTLLTTNDLPEVTTNTLTLFEEDLIVLTSANLAATDEETSNDQLLYTIDPTSLVAGEFFDADGNSILSFTQGDLDNGNSVFFAHDGSETAPAFSFTVSDGDGGETELQTANIDFTPVNDAPEFVVNSLTIEEGQTVTLTLSDLDATDIDTPQANLVYVITEVENGQFALANGAQLEVGDTFTRTQVLLEEVTFTASDNGEAPSYTLTADDQVGGTTVGIADITFTPLNDSPTLAVNSLPIVENQTLTLGSINLLIEDEETTDPAALTYTVAQVSGGEFFNLSTGTAVTSFTQADINDSQILFIHDGGEEAPTANVVLRDPDGGLTIVALEVNFTAQNDAPEITANSFEIEEGGSLVLSTANLNATDVDNDAADLVFTINNPQGGAQFNLDTNGDGVFEDQDVNSFTLQQVIDGQVELTDDGDELAPTFDIVLNDGTAVLPSEAGNVVFTAVNDAPTDLDLTLSAVTIDEGSTVTLSGDFLDVDSSVHFGTVDWGDGSAPEVIGNSDIIDGGSNDFAFSSLTHTYADDGIYTITVTIGDFPDNAEVTQTIDVTVAEVAPTATVTGAGPTEANALFTLSIGTPTDPGDDPVVEYLVDWGDGTQTSVSDPGDLTHVYKDVGNFDVTVTAIDDDGKSSTLGSVTADILFPIIDFNDDGNADILWRDATGGNFYFALNQGNFDEQVFLPSVSTQFQIADVADFNNDGTDDILWLRDNGEVYVWTIDDNSVTSITLPPVTTDFEVAGVTDFNNDGNQDIFWRNTTNGENYVWYTDGNANITSFNQVFTVSTDFQVEALADFNGDGFDDIFWRSQSTGQTFVWFIDDENLTITTFTDELGVVGTGFSLVDTADFNGDQNEDLVWTNLTTGNSQIWLLDGTSVLNVVTLADNPGFTLSGVTDFDGDQAPDLLWRDPVGGTAQIWLLDGTDQTATITLSDPGTGTEGFV